MTAEQKFRGVVQLALVDDSLENTELELLKVLGKQYQLNEGIIEEIINNELKSKDAQTVAFHNVDLDSKIDYLVDLVKIMKADGQIFLSEIRFCEKTAKNLGFKKKAISYLSGKIHSDHTVPVDWATVHQDMRYMVA